MSPSSLPAVVGHLSKKRGYPNASSAFGLELSLEANPPLNQCVQSQTSPRKRQKSVTFSAVDLIFVPTSPHEPLNSDRHCRDRQQISALPQLASNWRSSQFSRSPASRKRRHSTATAGPFECTPRAWYDPAYRRQHTDAAIYNLQSHAPVVDTTRRQRSPSNATPFKPPYGNSGSTVHYSPITGGSQERRFSVAQLTKSVFPSSQTNYLPSIPVDVCALTHGSNVPPPAHLPTPRFRSEVNQHIREALEHHSFDFAKHIKYRSYVVRLLGSCFTSSLSTTSSHECVAMLDEGVYRLLPSLFRTPPRPKEGNVLIEKAPGKGLGMFAQRLLRSGDVILSERPVLVRPYVMAVGIPVSEMYQQMFSLLSAHMRQQLLDLAVSAFPGRVVYGDEQDVHKTIIRINTFAINLPVPKMEFAELRIHRGIFVNMSRCNHRSVPRSHRLLVLSLSHSCGPNATWTWDPSSFSIVLTALRQIDPGHEITISYVSPQLSYYERRSKLSNLFSFDCACEFCLSIQDEGMREESDAARRFLEEIWDKALPSFEAWCRDPFYRDDELISAHKLALSLIHREGLEVLSRNHHRACSNLISDAYNQIHLHPLHDVIRHTDAITMCYGALADVVHFQKWMTRALDARLLSTVECDDRGEEHILVFDKWMSNPSRFPAWGWRKSKAGYYS